MFRRFHVLFPRKKKGRRDYPVDGYTLFNRPRPGNRIAPIDRGLSILNYRYTGNWVAHYPFLFFFFFFWLPRTSWPLVAFRLSAELTVDPLRITTPPLTTGGISINHRVERKKALTVWCTATFSIGFHDDLWKPRFYLYGCTHMSTGVWNRFFQKSLEWINP